MPTSHLNAYSQLQTCFPDGWATLNVLGAVKYFSPVQSTVRSHNLTRISATPIPKPQTLNPKRETPSPMSLTPNLSPIPYAVNSTPKLGIPSKHSTPAIFIELILRIRPPDLHQKPAKREKPAAARMWSVYHKTLLQRKVRSESSTCDNFRVSRATLRQ